MKLLNVLQTKHVSGANILAKDGDIYTYYFEHSSPQTIDLFGHNKLGAMDNIWFYKDHAKIGYPGQLLTSENCSSFGISFFQQEIFSGVTKYTFQLA